MGCSACSQRKSTGRIIPINPINPNKPKAERTGNTNTPTNRGNTLISKLRYTGR